MIDSKDWQGDLDWIFDPFAIQMRIEYEREKYVESVREAIRTDKLTDHIRSVILRVEDTADVKGTEWRWNPEAERVDEIPDVIAHRYRHDPLFHVRVDAVVATVLDYIEIAVKYEGMKNDRNDD